MIANAAQTSLPRCVIGLMSGLLVWLGGENTERDVPMYARMKELWHNSTVNNDQQLHLCCSCKHLSRKERKEKTTPFGVNLMRSQILCRAAKTCQPVPDSDPLWATVAHCQVQIDWCSQLQQRWSCQTLCRPAFHYQKLPA